MLPTFAQTPRAGRQDRPQSDGTAKKDMWSTMLDGVANGKRLPEKNIIVLGWSVRGHGGLGELNNPQEVRLSYRKSFSKALFPSSQTGSTTGTGRSPP